MADIVDENEPEPLTVKLPDASVPVVVKFSFPKDIAPDESVILPFSSVKVPICEPEAAVKTPQVTVPKPVILLLSLRTTALLGAAVPFVIPSIFPKSVSLITALPIMKLVPEVIECVATTVVKEPVDSWPVVAPILVPLIAPPFISTVAKVLVPVDVTSPVRSPVTSPVRSPVIPSEEVIVVKAPVLALVAPIVVSSIAPPFISTVAKVLVPSIVKFLISTISLFESRTSALLAAAVPGVTFTNPISVKVTFSICVSIPP